MNLKIFLSILVPLFLAAMGTGIYLAYSHEEGLVDDNYYEKGKNYFNAKSQEQHLSLAISSQQPLKLGGNDICISVTSHGKPFEHAALSLFIGNVSTKDYDRSMKMQERSPGNYHAEAAIPAGGKWLMRVEIEKNNLSTNRKWFFDVN
jgi:nitrogen fixation protein FixH